MGVTATAPWSGYPPSTYTPSPPISLSCRLSALAENNWLPCDNYPLPFPPLPSPPLPRHTRGRALEPDNPELLLRTIQLYHVAQAPPSGQQPADAAGAAEAPAPPSPVVARVLAEEADGLLGAGGLDGAVAGLVKLAGDSKTGSLGARVCAAKALALVTVPAEQGREQAVKLVREGLNGRGVTVPGCAAAVEAVRGILGETEAGAGATGAAEELRRMCATVFPLAEAFGASSAGEGDAATAPSG